MHSNILKQACGNVEGKRGKVPLYEGRGGALESEKFQEGWGMASESITMSKLTD